MAYGIYKINSKKLGSVSFLLTFSELSIKFDNFWQTETSLKKLPPSVSKLWLWLFNTYPNNYLSNLILLVVTYYADLLSAVTVLNVLLKFKFSDTIMSSDC